MCPNQKVYKENSQGTLLFKPMFSLAHVSDLHVPVFLHMFTFTLEKPVFSFEYIFPLFISIHSFLSTSRNRSCWPLSVSLSCFSVCLTKEKKLQKIEYKY